MKYLILAVALALSACDRGPTEPDTVTCIQRVITFYPDSFYHPNGVKGTYIETRNVIQVPNVRGWKQQYNCVN